MTGQINHRGYHRRNPHTAAGYHYRVPIHIIAAEAAMATTINNVLTVTRPANRLMPATAANTILGSFTIFPRLQIHGTARNAGISGCTIRLGFG